MKAKEVKVLRKKIEKADRLLDPIPALVDGTYGEYSIRAQAGNFRLEGNDRQLSLRWCKSWQDVKPDYLFPKMVELFRDNMGEMYKKSSWGLDLVEKKEEFQHRKARFLVVTTTASSSESNHDEEKKTANATDEPSSETNAEQPEELVAFCHYRFDFDDDQYPSCVALYLYEIQVAAAFQDCKIGQCIMQLLNEIAKQAVMPKIMLTVFKSNQRAMAFYTQKLQYEIDAISPSQNKEFADYEILSKTLE